MSPEPSADPSQSDILFSYLSGLTFSVQICPVLDRLLVQMFVVLMQFPSTLALDDLYEQVFRLLSSDGYPI